MQRNPEKVQEWCGNWGFRISADQRVAVLFTMNGKEIKTAKTAKFLGMIFDQNTTVRAH